MKKIVIIIIALLMSVVAFGQARVSEFIDGFKDGVFYVKIEQGTTLMFNIDHNTAQYDAFDDIRSGWWVANTEIESTEKGNEWFIEHMKDEDEQLDFYTYLYDNYGICMGRDFQVTGDGKARARFWIPKKI